MSRKDIIFETLKRQCELAKLEKKDLQIESSDLADALGYDRSNVSRDLNELVREGRVEKCRLPRYLTKPRQRRSEWDMAGSDGISRVSTVFRGKSLLTNKMRII